MNGFVKVFEAPPGYKYSRRSYKKLPLLQEGKNALDANGRIALGERLLYYDTYYPSGLLSVAKFGIVDIKLRDGTTTLATVTISDQFIVNSTTIVNVFFVPESVPETQPATIDNLYLGVKGPAATSSIFATKTLSPAISKTDKTGLIFEWAVTLTG